MKHHYPQATSPSNLSMGVTGTLQLLKPKNITNLETGKISATELQRRLDVIPFYEITLPELQLSSSIADSDNANNSRR
jgi:hypothetical protein